MRWRSCAMVNRLGAWSEAATDWPTLMARPPTAPAGGGEAGGGGGGEPGIGEGGVQLGGVRFAGLGRRLERAEARLGVAQARLRARQIAARRVHLRLVDRGIDLRQHLPGLHVGVEV